MWSSEVSWTLGPVGALVWAPPKVRPCWESQGSQEGSPGGAVPTNPGGFQNWEEEVTSVVPLRGETFQLGLSFLPIICRWWPLEGGQLGLSGKENLRSFPWAFWEGESQVLPKGNLREEEEGVSQEGCGEGRVTLHSSMFPMSAAGASCLSAWVSTSQGCPGTCLLVDGVPGAVSDWSGAGYVGGVPLSRSSGRFCRS